MFTPVLVALKTQLPLWLNLNFFYFIPFSLLQNSVCAPRAMNCRMFARLLAPFENQPFDKLLHLLRFPLFPIQDRIIGFDNNQVFDPNCRNKPLPSKDQTI